MSIEDRAKEVRRRWGSDEQFYKELQDFMERHSSCQSVIIDNSTGYPLYAQYIFWPNQVAREQEHLLAKLGEAAREWEAKRDE